MLTLMKCFRACRSVCRTSDITPKVASWGGAGHQHEQNRSKLPCPRPRRSVWTNADLNIDPLHSFAEIYPLDDLHIMELTGGDPVEVKKLRLLQMELAVKYVTYPYLYPEKLRLKDWKVLLSLPPGNQTQYLIVLNKKRKPKGIASQPTLECDGVAKFADVNYCPNIFEHKLYRNSLLPMLHDTEMGYALNSRLLDAFLFNQPIVMDFGYESVMTLKEIKNLCQQVGVCLNVNKYAPKPCKMVFCNLHKESLIGETMWSAVPSLWESHVPIETTEKCYTELYPIERLVYLTPHCREPLNYDPDDVYVIGAMVDKTNPGPHSLIKAKAQNLRMASFPLDKYLVWRKGTKSLTLNQVLQILLKYAHTRDWKQAFKVVPKRKIIDAVDLNRKKRVYYFNQ